jgi:chromosome segregation ATPase
MESEQVAEKTIHLQAKNVGGIDKTDVTFEPGVTILTGRNATNRTSFLQAIMGGLGSDQVSLKGDADSGHISLQVGDTEYTRNLERQRSGVALGGDPYLDDPHLADLFAFLLESNDARRAVALEDDLRDIIMDPVDDKEIQAEIQTLKSRRDEMDSKIEERQSLKEKLPTLKEELRQVEENLEEKRHQLEKKRAELEEQSTEPEDARTEESELEEKMQSLQQKRSALDSTSYQLESQEDSISSLQDEQAELENEYENLTDTADGEIDTLDSEINRLRDQKQRLESELSKLQSVIQFNEEMLEGASQDIAAALRGEDTDSAVTDQLLETEDSIVCWTCGTEVDQESIEETLSQLQKLRQSKFADQSDIDDELADLKNERSQIKSQQEQRDRVKRQLADIRAEIGERESKHEELEAKQDDLNEKIERLENEIAELEAEDRSEVLEVHREVNEREIDIERLESERDRTKSNITDLKSRIEEMSDLEDQRDMISEQLEELRTRIDRIEEGAVESFNSEMETVLDILDYDNLDRIWVERAETEVQEGRRKVTKTEFRLHIIRTASDGAAYEDEFTHLSESEREVTGLVFALAGYLAHEVHKEVPFILLDSLEAIDSERISALIDYLRDYAENLVVALLEEDAVVLDESYTRITDV